MQAGLLFGVFSVVATAQFNIWQGSKQRDLQLSSTQLLYAIAFPQALLCFVFALAFEFSEVWWWVNIAGPAPLAAWCHTPLEWAGGSFKFRVLCRSVSPSR